MFVISSSVPLSPKLTLLHKYTLVNFSTVVVLLCTISIMQVQAWTSDEMHSADASLFIVIAAIDGSIQVGFMLTSFYYRHMERRKLTMSAYELDKLGKDQEPIFVKGAGIVRDSKRNAAADPSVVFEAMAGE